MLPEGSVLFKKTVKRMCGASVLGGIPISNKVVLMQS